RTATDISALDSQLARMRPDTVVEEHGQFRDGITCAAYLVPRRQGSPSWAAGLTVPDEVVPQHGRRELRPLASDFTSARAAARRERPHVGLSPGTQSVSASRCASTVSGRCPAGSPSAYATSPAGPSIRTADERSVVTSGRRVCVPALIRRSYASTRNRPTARR